MSRKGENIFKRKDGRYEGRYVKDYHNGRAIYGYVYAKTYAECKKRRNNILIELKINKSKTKTKKNYKDLNYFVTKWLDSKANIKESTYTKYNYIIEKYIKNDIGKINFNKINSDLVNKYITKFSNNNLKEKCSLSKNTVYSICTVLKQVFKANELNINIIKINQTIGVGKSFKNNDKFVLEKKLMKINNNISIGILLSLFLGLRKSEVCGIQYKDIDIDNKIININHIVSRVISKNTKNKTKLIITTPKTDKSKRQLPIPDKLLNKLTELKMKQNDNDFLLTGNKKCIDPRTFYNYYKKYLKSINLNYTYHDLRHTFATNCIELGIDPKSLMELLGHSNISTTMNVYVHPSMNEKRLYINQL